MDAGETAHDEAGALSLSTNATAFCIASLLGASDRDDVDEGRLTPDDQQEGPEDIGDHAVDTDDGANESKISGETSCN